MMDRDSIAQALDDLAALLLAGCPLTMAVTRRCKELNSHLNSLRKELGDEHELRDFILAALFNLGSMTIDGRASLIRGAMTAAAEFQELHPAADVTWEDFASLPVLDSAVKTRFAESFRDLAARLRFVKATDGVVAVEPPELPEIDEKLCQIRYRGVCHEVSAETARLVALLRTKYPDWFSASAAGFSRPSDNFNELPESLKAIVERQPSKGYRLKPG